METISLLSIRLVSRPVFVWASVFAVGGASAWAGMDTTALMMSSEVAAQGVKDYRDSITTSQASVSQSVYKGTKSSKSGSISLTEFSMILGPGLSTLSTAAPTSGAPFTGIGARHELRMDYHLSDAMSVSPMLDVSEYFYDARQGRLVLNDPSVRFSITDLNQFKFNRGSYSDSVWISGYAPVSTISQALHSYGAASIAYVPKLRIQGSRFFYSGVTQAKFNVMENPSQSAIRCPVQLVAAAQANYRQSSNTTFFLMNHVNGNVGPNMAQMLISTGIAADNYRRKAQAQNAVTDGFMLGTMFQFNHSVLLSPRLDWTINQPLGTTTLGLNASFHLI